MRSAGIPRAVHLRLPSRDGKREPNELSSLLRVSCQLFGVGGGGEEESLHVRLALG